MSFVLDALQRQMPFRERRFVLQQQSSMPTEPISGKMWILIHIEAAGSMFPVWYQRMMRIL